MYLIRDNCRLKDRQQAVIVAEMGSDEFGDSPTIDKRGFASNIHKINKGVHRTPLLILAEREGFEPSIRYYRIHTFQACSFNHSDISPNNYCDKPSLLVTIIQVSHAACPLLRASLPFAPSGPPCGCPELLLAIRSTTRTSLPSGWWMINPYTYF